MRKTGRLILVSGASRSGKSAFAEKLVRGMDKSVAYLATAQALDDEMRERIKKHRERRPGDWRTFEEPLQADAVIADNCKDYQTWLLDCVTLYLSNLLLADPEISEETERRILEAFHKLIAVAGENPLTLVAVTNEVGWGLVPPDPLSRFYRDLAGRINQELADKADEVYLVTLGVPIKIKPELQVINGL